MNQQTVKYPSIEAAGISVGKTTGSPGSNLNMLIHQFQGQYSRKNLYNANRETPDSICKKINRM